MMTVQSNNMERFGGYNGMKRDYLELLRDGSPQSVLAMAAAATNRFNRFCIVETGTDINEAFGLLHKQYAL